MTPSALALAALLSLPWFGHSPDVRRAHHRVGPWTITIIQERFADGSPCQLTASRMEYRRGALVIHLPAGTDTFDAIYRIDGGPPRSVRSDAKEIATLGFALHDDDLLNPSGGLVRIPVGTLAGASQVAIQAHPGSRIYRFRVGELQSALGAARTAGCAPAAFQ